MTAQDIIDRVRWLLKDDIEPYRLADADFFPFITDGLREMEARRPDLLILATGSLATVTDIAATTTAITFPDRIREALACYTSYWSYISEDADRHNTSQATTMLNRYESLMQTI